MRLGIYAGRHQRGDAAWVSSRSYILSLLDNLRGDATTEVVLYVSPVTLDKRLQEGVELSPVLVTFATNYFYNGASRYFRKLPNGAQCRMLIRFLPLHYPRVVDHLFLSWLAWRDKLDILHVLELSVPRVLCPVVLSIPPNIALADSSAVNKKEGKHAERSISPIRGLGVLRRAAHVICNFERDRELLVRGLGLSASRVSISPPALDQAFVRAAGAELNKPQALMLDGKRTEPGFLVISVPPGDARSVAITCELVKNLCRSNAEPETARTAETISVVVLCDDERQEKKLRKANGATPVVVIPLRIHRTIMLTQARAVILLHSGNEKYCSVLEAHAVGVTVLCDTSELKNISLDEEGVGGRSIIHINIEDVAEICAAVRALWALKEGEGKKTQHAARQLKKSAKHSPRGYDELLGETRVIYQKICMQQGHLRK